MEKDLRIQDKSCRNQAKYVFVVVVVVVLSFCTWWLASDREPQSKEMTWAFIKHYETTYTDRAPKDQIEDRQRLVEFDLKKQHCQKIEIKRYRCEAAVFLNGQSVDDKTEGDEAIYTHDAMGWRFEPAGKGRTG